MDWPTESLPSLLESGGSGTGAGDGHGEAYRYWGAAAREKVVARCGLATYSASATVAVMPKNKA
uniref:Uncharacterized protein n=1 Tax=Oryza barthii TaxID=65489 RepID=A0A0D3GV63_9ORYZ